MHSAIYIDQEDVVAPMARARYGARWVGGISDRRTDGQTVTNAHWIKHQHYMQQEWVGRVSRASDAVLLFLSPEVAQQAVAADRYQCGQCDTDDVDQDRRLVSSRCW